MDLPNTVQMLPRTEPLEFLHWSIENRLIDIHKDIYTGYIPSILRSNARAPIAQLVRASDQHSEDQMSLLAGSQATFSSKHILVMIFQITVCSMHHKHNSLSSGVAIVSTVLNGPTPAIVCAAMTKEYVPNGRSESSNRRGSAVDSWKSSAVSFSTALMM